MSEPIENIFAKMFIARTDVMAEQHSNGIYTPVEKKFTRVALQEHLAGSRSLGHYLVGLDGNVKVFAFDIDWESEGRMPTAFDHEGIPTEWIISKAKRKEGGIDFPAENEWYSPRALWRQRDYIGRQWMKGEMMQIAWGLASVINKELELKTAVAYSGNKGLHVYAFPPYAITAEDAKRGARIVLKDFAKAIEVEGVSATKGENFFRVPNKDEYDANENISIEIFPKQTKVQEGGYGNLMRLPLGRNLKAPNDPTFFIDLSKSSMCDWVPVKSENVVTYLQNGVPWK